MDREEVIKWLIIMKANLNSFPEVSNAKKIEALAEAIRLLKNEQSEIQTSSDDCISRKAALEIYDEWFATCNIADRKASPKAKINALPSVKIRSRKGEWCKQNDDYFDWYECSECGYGGEGEMQYSSEYDVRTNYCPQCGADMREVEE